jgi:hypothetical protein
LENNFRQPRDLLKMGRVTDKKRVNLLFLADVGDADDEVRTAVPSQIHATATLSIEDLLSELRIFL